MLFYCSFLLIYLLHVVQFIILPFSLIVLIYFIYFALVYYCSFHLINYTVGLCCIAKCFISFYFTLFHVFYFQCRWIEETNFMPHVLLCLILLTLFPVVSFIILFILILFKSYFTVFRYCGRDNFDHRASSSSSSSSPSMTYSEHRPFPTSSSSPLNLCLVLVLLPVSMKGLTFSSPLERKRENGRRRGKKDAGKTKQREG